MPWYYENSYMKKNSSGVYLFFQGGGGRGEWRGLSRLSLSKGMGAYGLCVIAGQL